MCRGQNLFILSLSLGTLDTSDSWDPNCIEEAFKLMMSSFWPFLSSRFPEMKPNEKVKAERLFTLYVHAYYTIHDVHS